MIIDEPVPIKVFIIALELLAINIRNNDQIREIRVNGNEIQLVIFADDETTVVCAMASFSLLFNTIERFGSYSSLNMNHENTEVIPLGNMELESAKLGVKEISSEIKILGIHFTYNHQLFYHKILSLLRNL